MAGAGWQFSVTIPSWTQTTLEGDDLVVVRVLMHCTCAQPGLLQSACPEQLLLLMCNNFFMHCSKRAEDAGSCLRIIPRWSQLLQMMPLQCQHGVNKASAHPDAWHGGPHALLLLTADVCIQLALLRCSSIEWRSRCCPQKPLHPQEHVACCGDSATSPSSFRGCAAHMLPL